MQRQSFEKSANQSQKNLRLADFDEIDGLAIGLQGTKSVLFVHFGIVVQGTKDDFVALRELLYLVESPQLVSFFKRIRDAGQEYENLHYNLFEEAKVMIFL